jgi:putative tryptophan/tyrosine transport system substrate-binding protein
MNRRAFLTGLGAVLAAPLAVEGQPPTKPVRVGVLSGGPAMPNPGVDAFREALAALGWVEGRNIMLDVRFADGKVDRLPALAAELVRLQPHVIVAASSTVAQAAHEATARIPIVMVGVGDPIGLGFARSLRAPGGNMTGLASLLPELSSKSLQLLRELVPGLTRVAVLMNPSNPLHEPSLRETEAAAATLGIQVIPMRAREPGELAGAFAAMVKAHASAVEIYGDAMFVRQRIRIAELALSSRLPAMCRLRTEVEAGALVAYGPDYVDLYRRAAGFVDRILKGVRPDELPIEQPTRVELILNLKTAKALGLTIPPSLLLRAAQVIE